MNNIIIEKLDLLIHELDKSSLIKDLKVNKEKLYQDSFLKKLLEDIKKIDNKYSKEYKDAKIKIMNNERFIKYKEKENELFYLVLEINKILNQLVDEKSCRL